MSRRVVKGFVVRKETAIRDDTTGVTRRVRADVGRVYHAKSAAEAFLAMCQKEWPGVDFYVHERTGKDDGASIT